MPEKAGEAFELPVTNAPTRWKLALLDFDNPASPSRRCWFDRALFLKDQRRANPTATTTTKAAAAPVIAAAGNIEELDEFLADGKTFAAVAGLCHFSGGTGSGSAGVCGGDVGGTDSCGGVFHGRTGVGFGHLVVVGEETEGGGCCRWGEGEGEEFGEESRETGEGEGPGVGEGEACAPSRESGNGEGEGARKRAWEGMRGGGI